MNRFVRQLSHSSFDCRQLFHLAISCHSLFHAIIFLKNVGKKVQQFSCSEDPVHQHFYFILLFKFFLLFKPRLKEQKAEKEKLARNFLSLFSPLDQNKSETSSFFSMCDHNRSTFEKK